jgi:hypothetical protein
MMQSPLDFLNSLDAPTLVKTTLLAKPFLLTWLQQEMGRGVVLVGQDWNHFRLLLDDFTVCVIDREGKTPPFAPLPSDFVPNFLELQADETTVLFAVHGTVLINRLPETGVPQGLSQMMQQAVKNSGRAGDHPSASL